MSLGEKFFHGVVHFFGIVVLVLLCYSGIVVLCMVLSGHWAGCIIGTQFRQLALPQARKQRPAPLSQESLLSLFLGFYSFGNFIYWRGSKYLKCPFKTPTDKFIIPTIQMHYTVLQSDQGNQTIPEGLKPFERIV